MNLKQSELQGKPMNRRRIIVGTLFVFVVVVVLFLVGVWWFRQSINSAPKYYEYYRPNNLIASLCGADTTTLNARLRADFLLRLQENRQGEFQNSYPQLVEHPGVEGLLLSLPPYGKRDSDGYSCSFVLPDGGNDTLVVFPEYYPPLKFRTTSGGYGSNWPPTDNSASYHMLYQQTRQRYWVFVQKHWGYPVEMYGPFAEPADYPPIIAKQMADIRRQTIADAYDLP